MGIRTIIIMNPSGIPYFAGNYICPMGRNCDVLSKQNEKNMDPLLISGFFTALMNLAKASGGQLQQVEFENFQYLAQSHNNIIAIMAIAIDDKVEEYTHRLQVTLELFWNEFGESLDSWNNNVEFFNAFQTILDGADIFDHDPTYRKNCIECEINQDCTFRMVTGAQPQDFREKMAKFPKVNFFKKWILMMKEFMKYMKQLRRYKKFQKAFKVKKTQQPSLKIVDFMQVNLTSKS